MTTTPAPVEHASMVVATAEPTEPEKPLISTAAATWALFFGVGLLMAGSGLQGTLIGVRAEAEDFSVAVIGLVMTGYYVGFLAGSRVTVNVVNRVGHVRVFAALASTASIAALLYGVAVTPLSWAGMRFLTGVCMAGLYIVAESWLNDLATNQNRGRLLAIYMVMLMGGVAVGQLLLNVADPDGISLFILSSILVSSALIPIALSEGSSPRVVASDPIPVRRLAKLAPTGVVSSFWIGASHGTLMGLGAVYAAAEGLTAREVSVFLAAAMVGAVLLQWPVGSVSDRISRGGVMIVVALLAAATCIGLTVVDADSAAAIALMFVLGGMTFPLYSLAGAYTNDRLEPGQIMGASSAIVRINGIGAIVGPLLAAGVMAIDVVFLFWLLSAFHVIIALYVVFNLSTRGAPEPSGPWMPIGGRSSEIVWRTAFRRRRKKAAAATTPEP